MMMDSLHIFHFLVDAHVPMSSRRSFREGKKRLAQQKEALLNALAEEERRNEHPPLKRDSADSGTLQKEMDLNGGFLKWGYLQNHRS
jgi:hypothetical protein